MIVDSIKKEFDKAKKRFWTQIYAMIDIHETVVKPNYDVNNTPTECYDHAISVLKAIQDRGDIVLIMWTCSHKPETDFYLKWFKEKHGIDFKYVNENPEVTNGSYGCFDKKPYTNILLDDKAGFNPETEWILIDEFLNNQPIL